MIERGCGERFEDAFRALYLAYHRRDGHRSEVPAASRAVLTHLALTAPVSVGELALHLQRAQSVVSEIVAHLVHDGYLERDVDPADRRRSLIWLTAQGRALLDRLNRVLDVPRLEEALACDPGADALIDALQALAARARPPQPAPHARHGSPTLPPPTAVSSIAFALWTCLLKYNNVGMVSVFNFLIPVFGALLSAIFLGESIFEWKYVLALLLVCVGIWRVTRRN